MIFPEIFDGKVMGTFTTRHSGINIQDVTGGIIYMPIQKHTDIIIDVEDDLDPKEGDAVFTQRTDIMLGIKCADCVPILLFDPHHQTIGAVHAGWRGTAAGILRKSIKHMKDKYNASEGDIRVAIGPAIRWCCYEVGQDVLDKVMQATGDGEYHKNRDGKICLDLQSANRIQALDEGIIDYHISVTEECTFCMPEKYYSYRYDKTTGRQGGFIGLP